MTDLATVKGQLAGLEARFGIPTPEYQLLPLEEHAVARHRAFVAAEAAFGAGLTPDDLPDGVLELMAGESGDEDADPFEVRLAGLSDGVVSALSWLRTRTVGDPDGVARLHAAVILAALGLLSRRWMLAERVAELEARLRELGRDGDG